MVPPHLTTLVPSVPAGRWAVGVSGGADSVAMLALLRLRADLVLHVVHLDHETRGRASAEDAAFVAALAARWGLACTVARISEVAADRPAGGNPSARYRAARLALFRRVVAEHSLSGVVLAHHADDNAETILHRLLRGSGPSGLCGMEPCATVAGLTILRPLLPARRSSLRQVLRHIDQPWREDESNASDRYLRNRLRRLLEARPELTEALLALGQACAETRDWVRANTPDFTGEGGGLPVGALRALPIPLAREAARRWLAGKHVPPDDLTPDVLDRLIEMAADAASPPRRHFPGGLLVRRRAGRILMEAGDGDAGTAQ